MATLYCRPSDIVTDSATVTLAAGTADAAYPLTSLYDRKAHTIFKATSNACTPRATFGGAQTIQACALIHHNLPTATVARGNPTVRVSAGWCATAGAKVSCTSQSISASGNRARRDASTGTVRHTSPSALGLMSKIRRGFSKQ